MAFCETSSEPTYTLYLSRAEAKTLLAVLHRVGGNPDDTIRSHSDDVMKALEDEGVAPYKDDCKGHVSFQ